MPRPSSKTTMSADNGKITRIYQIYASID